MSDSEGQHDHQPAQEPASITPIEPPGFHPDESLIDSSKRHENPWVETRRMISEGESLRDESRTSDQKTSEHG
jgi:hypothetical protein